MSKILILFGLELAERAGFKPSLAFMESVSY